MDKSDPDNEGEECKEVTYKKVTYDLFINNIRAIIFHNNVGILCFELENHIHRSVEAIKHINDYGRRINLPFVYNGETSHALTAEEISILGDRVVFRDFGEKAIDSFKNSENAPVNKDGTDKTGFINIIPPIYNLINRLLHGCRYVPVLDDRMFVCCMICDNALSKKVKPERRASDIIGELAQKETVWSCKDDLYIDPALSRELYSIAFIDSGPATCQSSDMREKLLRRCVYDRWRDYGTIDVITHHSLIRITGEHNKEKCDILDSVINPFLSQYVTLAIGALIQRASILQLSKRCAEISEDYFFLRETRNNLNADKKRNADKSDDEAIEKSIKDLKREYVYAQSNIFLNQLTVQEQGVEEFDMLKRELYIDDSLEKLDRTVNCIYDFTTEFAEEEENRFLSAITKIGLPLALMQVLSAFLSFNFLSGKTSWLQALGFGALLAFSVLISWFGINLYIPRINSKKRVLFRNLVLAVCIACAAFCVIGFVFALYNHP